MPIYKQKEKKDGLFKYKVRVNYTDSYGAHKQLTRTVWGSTAAKELEQQLLKTVSDHQLSNSSITIKELCTEFLTARKHDIRATTLRRYNVGFTNHIIPYIGDVPLKKLNIKILNKWKTEINEKSLSLVSRQNIYKDLRALLNYAVKLEYIPVSPLDKVGNFRDANYQKKDITFYTPEEFIKFRTVALDTAIATDFFDYYVFFCIAYYTGARKGEIHALRWNCIDSQRLYIKKSISQKLRGDDVETPPKNKSSIRTLQIPRPLLEILMQHKQRQQESIPNWKDTGFICGYYKPLRDTSIENENKKYSTAAGIKKIRVHDFRHSHASLLINNHVNPLEVAHRLGHSTVDQTLKTYAHLFPNEEKRTMDILNQIL